MAFNFPNTPTTNDTFTAGGITWIYDGTAWNIQTTAATLATETVPGLVEKATVAEVRSWTADTYADAANLIASAAEQTLSDGATVAFNMEAGWNAVVTLGGNRTLGNPTNANPGQSGRIRVVQDGTGSRTLAYAANWEFPGGTAPVLTTTANAQDVLYYDVISATRILVTWVGNIS